VNGWRSTAWSTGTSPATAIVAGCLALVKQKYPDATGNQLVQDLIHYTGGSHPFGWDPHYGFGIASVTEMLEHDPTRWPDVNPLLHGPKAAVKDFPSSYGKATAADGSASGKASASPTAAAAGKTGRSGKAGSVGSGAGSSGGGVPPWVWVIVAVVVLGGAGGTGVTLRKRGRAEPGAGTGPSA
ncbi:MAG: S8 family serine peptidase, partial [Sciscionella sp.]